MTDDRRLKPRRHFTFAEDLEAGRGGAAGTPLTFSRRLSTAPVAVPGSIESSLSDIDVSPEITADIRHLEAEVARLRGRIHRLRQQHRSDHLAAVRRLPAIPVLDLMVPRASREWHLARWTDTEALIIHPDGLQVVFHRSTGTSIRQGTSMHTGRYTVNPDLLTPTIESLEAEEE